MSLADDHRVAGGGPRRFRTVVNFVMVMKHFPTHHFLFNCHILCETRTVVIDTRKCMNLKITTYNIVFQKVEKNNFFSRRKSQLLL